MEQAEEKKMIAEMNDFLSNDGQNGVSDSAVQAHDSTANNIQSCVTDAAAASGGFANNAKNSCGTNASAPNDAQDGMNEAVDPDDGLPFETIEMYGTDPIGFEDMAFRMLAKVEAVFDLAVKYNRHSSKYLKMCAQLEKGLKYLGSLCLTKYAMEQHDQTFPKLGQLNTEKLYIMASIHFKKLDNALTEYMQQKGEMDDALLDMLYRYFSLLDRIRSTEVRIHKYDFQKRFGEENYDPATKGLAFSEKSWTKDLHKKNQEPHSFRHSPAFPLLGGAREMIGGGKAAGNLQNKQKSDGDIQSAAVSSMSADENLSNPDAVQSTEAAASDTNEGSNAQNAVIQDTAMIEQQADEAANHQDGAAQKEAGIEPKADGDIIMSEAESDAAAVSSAEETESMHREQFSRTGSHRSVSDAMRHESDPRRDGAKRNRQTPGTVPDSGPKTARIPKQNEADPNPPNEIGDPPDPGEVPLFVRIMRRVRKRSEEQGNEGLIFTEEEMEYLAGDPEFHYYMPKMAAEVRRIWLSDQQAIGNRR